MDFKDLIGKSVKVIDANDDVLIIEVGGRRYRIYPDYLCENWDCSGPGDPSNPFLVIEEVEEE